MNIGKRFADHHRAELERLVAEGFELIEIYSVLNYGRGSWGNDPTEGALTPFEFQLLVAAWVYLQTTPDGADP